MEIDMIRGDTLVLTFQLTDENGEMILMSDIDTLILTARQRPNQSSDIIFAKNKEKFYIDDGLYAVEILPVDTEQQTVSTLFLDIEVTLIDGTRKTKVMKLNLERDVTIHGGDKIEN